MAPERRRGARDNTWIDAECRIDGIAHRATLTNVSKYGCCAVMDGRVALPGERVMLRLTDLLVVPATVKWIHPGKVGLAFANPLLGGMLSKFALSNGSGRDRLN